MSSREPDGLLTTPERVITYILTDLVQPKNPYFPVVQVSSTSSETDEIPRKKSRINKHVTGVLAVGTSNLFHTKHESLRQAKKETREELSRLGFTVYVGGPRRIYVIEYDPSFHAEQSKTWLYVGETGQTIEERLEQHFSGHKKASRHWEKLLRRRPDLEPPSEYWSNEDSTEAETKWALFLSNSGYLIRGPEGFDPKTGLPHESKP